MRNAICSSIPMLATLVAGCVTSPVDEEASQALEDLQTSSASHVVASGRPTTCFSQVGGSVVTLDLASETITATPDHFAAVALSSLGLTENHLMACGSTTLDILDLATGVTTSVDLPCDAVTAQGDKIYVQSLSNQSLTEYANLRAVIAKQASRSLPAPFASRLGAGHGRLLASWHSTDEVLAVDLETGATTAVPLPNYDGWIFGLFENAKVRLVAGGWVETGLNLYDTVSGQPRGRLFDGVWLQGLACSTAK